MINIDDKALCTGCGACMASCPVDAIILTEDREGFRYPVIDEAKCIKCGKCDSVCGMYKENSRGEGNSNEIFYAGYLKNTEDLSEVSSGGAFWALVNVVISRGGVVYGAASHGIEDIVHERAETISEAEKFRRSKYFQSYAVNSYAQVKNDLISGREVLFSGTACQVDALYNFLGKEYSNLYTCEVVCHGVPSMTVFRSYRSELEEKYNSKMNELVFRDKTFGWRNNHYKIRFENGEVIKEPSVKNLFHAGYLQGIFYRPSCGQCKYAQLPRVSDITLADYWRYEGELIKGNNMGISLIVCSSEKGRGLLENAREYMHLEVSDREKALKSCRHLNNHPSGNPNRYAFFEDFYNDGYVKTIRKYLPRKTLAGVVKKKLHGIKKRLYSIKKNRGN